MLSRLVTRLVIAVAGLLIIAVLVIATVAFLGVALYFALLTWLTPPLAALATAGAALAVGAVVAVLVARAVHLRRRANEPFAMRLGRELASLANEHTTGTVAAALLAGFAVGAVPPLREALKEVLAKTA